MKQKLIKKSVGEQSGAQKSGCQRSLEGEIAERVLGLWYNGHCGWAQSTLAGCVGGGKWVLMILVAWTFGHDFVWSDD